VEVVVEALVVGCREEQVVVVAAPTPKLIYRLRPA